MTISFRQASATLAALLFILILIHNQARAQATPAPFIQNLPQQYRNDQYVAQFAAILDAWNLRELELPSKANLRATFEQRVSRTVQFRLYAYETDAWQGLMLKNFDQLPANLRPEKRLDPSAGTILIVLFLKDLDEFKRQVKTEEVKSALYLPLFTLLGSAQEAAKAKNLPTIDSNEILRSLLGWWTTTWPFCRASAP